MSKQLNSVEKVAQLIAEEVKAGNLEPTYKTIAKLYTDTFCVLPNCDGWTRTRVYKGNIRKIKKLFPKAAELAANIHLKHCPWHPVSQLYYDSLPAQLESLEQCEPFVPHFGNKHNPTVGVRFIYGFPLNRHRRDMLYTFYVKCRGKNVADQRSSVEKVIERGHEHQILPASTPKMLKKLNYQ